MLLFGYETNIIIILLKGLYLIFLLKASMTLYFVQCVKEGRTVWRILAQNPMELGARLGKPCNKILRNLIHVHKYVLAYACVYVARCQRMLQALRY